MEIKSDDRNPPEVFLVGIVNSLRPVLPPESFKRRNYVIKISVNPVVSFFAHLYCVSSAVEQVQSL